MIFKKKRSAGAKHDVGIKTGVRRKRSAYKPGRPKPWPNDKPPGGKLQSKRLADGTIELTPIED